MTFQVTVTPSGRQFSCDADETVFMPHSVRASFCLTAVKMEPAVPAKAKSLMVTVRQSSATRPQRSEAAQGMSLFCCAKPQSDLPSKRVKWSPADEYPVKKCRPAYTNWKNYPMT
jgi:CDP-4-dehydro-6-deoxyglucose reductase